MDSIETAPILEPDAAERKLVISGLIGPIVLDRDILVELQKYNLPTVNELLQRSASIEEQQEAEVIDLEEYRRSREDKPGEIDFETIGTELEDEVGETGPDMAEEDDYTDATPLDAKEGEVLPEGTIVLTAEDLLDNPDTLVTEDDKTDHVINTGRAKALLAEMEAGRIDKEGEYTQDSLTMLMREIGRSPLLSYEEQVALAKRVEAGDHEAKQQMIASNMRLVVKIAKHYKGKGVPLLDLIQEGTFGLNRAVEKYDWRRGYQFSTYAWNWIRQSCQRAISSKGTNIRVPTHVVERQQKLRRATAKFLAEFGYEPTREDLARATKLKLGHVDEALDAAVANVSLNKDVGNDDGELGDLFADSKSPDAFEEASVSLKHGRVREAMANLSERERRILELRFGFDGPAATLQYIGEELDLTRERVRQLEKEALQKLAFHLKDLDEELEPRSPGSIGTNHIRNLL